MPTQVFLIMGEIQPGYDFSPPNRKTAPRLYDKGLSLKNNGGHSLFLLSCESIKNAIWLCTKLQLTIYQDQKLAPQRTQRTQRTS
jgi:hypothetical protein